MTDWTIYYSDGSTFSSDDGEWAEAPGWDFQIALFRDPINGWQMRHQGDFYRLAEDGTVVAMDLPGMLDHVVNVLGAIKVGRMLTWAEWNALYKRATDALQARQGAGG